MDNSQHVIPNGTKWRVRKTGSLRASKIFNNESMAIKYASGIASEENSKVFVHYNNGEVKKVIDQIHIEIHSNNINVYSKSLDEKEIPIKVRATRISSIDRKTPTIVKFTRKRSDEKKAGKKAKAKWMLINEWFK